MHVFLIALLGVLATYHANSYVIPPGEINMYKGSDINQGMPSRKQNFKRFEVRKRAEDPEEDTKNIILKPLPSLEKKISRSPAVEQFEEAKVIPEQEGKEKAAPDMDSVVISIDTGAKTKHTKPSRKGDLIDTIEGVLKQFFKQSKADSPLMRARDEFNIKPEVIQLRSGQPSLKFEINSDTVINAFHSLLSSPLVRRYADDIAKKAAVFFKVVNDEMRRNTGDA